MKYDYFDIHSHFNLESFDADWPAAVKMLEEKNIGTFCIGVDYESSRKAVEISATTEHVFPIVGYHPAYVHKLDYLDLGFFRELLDENRDIVAVGEIGLDYFRMDPDDHVGRDHQKTIFREQIELALEYDLPIMLHIRATAGDYDAYEDTLEILEEIKKEAGEKLRGDAHFFVATKEIADRFIALDFMVSFTGVVTFTQDYDEVIQHVPIDMMMAETDSPYVAPAPFRGKRAEPWMVEKIYDRLAILKEVDLEVLKKHFDDNRKRLFKI